MLCAGRATRAAAAPRCGRGGRRSCTGRPARCSSNPGSFPVWPSHGPGLQGHDLCAHTHWRHSRGPTPAASLATCPPHAGRSLAGLVTCLCMQDAPWQAWSHAIACRTLPGASLAACHCMQESPWPLAWSHADACRTPHAGTWLGHMPLHGRSLRHLAWSHAAACRTLPGCASPRQMQSTLEAPCGAGVGSNSTTSGAHSITLSDASPSCQRSLHATAASARQPVIIYTHV